MFLFKKAQFSLPRRIFSRSAMSSAISVLADDPNIAKPLLDDRKYRLLKLDHSNLHILLIHDPTTDRAAASLDVNVGSFADRKYNVAGLAHFCEHLLFMGTSKYPEENEYASYLSKHSGHSNAYTAAEHTNYYFEVDSAHLEGALDRFAQFFISPLFSRSCKDREIQAVDSENKKNLQNDMWRMYQLDKSTSNPKHPYNGFSTGNFHTLQEEPASRGEDVRDILLRFYKNEYSANLMSLVVLGNESLDVLEKWAVDKFSPVENSNLARPSYDELVFTEAQMGKITRAKPIMDTRKLELSFMIPNDQEQNWKCRPSGYFAHLLGHESKGSVLHFLKTKNWVNDLSAGAIKVCQGNSLLMIELELTPSGLDHWQDIVVHIFEYLDMVKSFEPQQWLWKEESAMSEINFRFRQKMSASSTVSKMSNKLYQFSSDGYIPPENLLDSSVLREFNPTEISKYGSYLVPSNLRLSLTSRDLLGLSSKEKWYGTEYSYEDIPAELLQRIQSLASNPELHLPKHNSFIPENFSVRGEKVQEPLAHPFLISDSAQFETWFKQDDQFGIPKGYINLTVHIPTLNENIKSALMATLLSELIDDELNEIEYYASLVGLSFSIHQFKDSYSLKVGGYNDKLPVYLSQILEYFTSFTPKKDRFESIKYKVTQELKNSGFETPYSQIGTHFLQFINERTYPDLEKLAIINEITFDQIAEFANGLWKKGTFVQTLIIGNFDYATATVVDKSIKKNFEHISPINSSKDKVLESIKFESFELQTGENVRYVVPLQDANNINSCLEYFVRVGTLGEENRRLRVLTDLLAVMIHEPCFNQLRTKEQLGYVVFSGYRPSRSYFGLRVLVQSERACDYLEYRVVQFLRKFKKSVLGDKLTEEAFNKYKQALKSKKLTKLKNLGEESSRFWNHINDGFYDFMQKSKDVQLLETITPDEFLHFFNEYFDVDNASKSALLTVYLESQKTPVLEQKKLFTTALHNFIYDNDIPISIDNVDAFVEEAGLDVAAVASFVEENLSDKSFDFSRLKESFINEITERTARATPEIYPRGKTYEKISDFQSTHKKGGAPNPVVPLSTYNYASAHL
ncbi:putative A-factor-processing enzyme [Clavispora lusitaniae]|uniref:A-factor-processing enzyme n=1 Tax=Clavispora lusitaniae TaxID=36911 RepID=A0ACD0WQE9_CLALS|nr:putative A-factor-processing enzyme [Clavispora lusitaniae]QFZ35256.1 putative A-factor-processing enzyme [Clavispora lusitaniae]QFZ40950.1 putative A-factor-processing enzyme [Clavispora lusitaniae]QFZ46631.1 putative A-factor-processing enzyme [Clavispora lusitaniae]QFZ52296.1 putative A-factor-processing enzyme [Clavispora lusitaniae]